MTRCTFAPARLAGMAMVSALIAGCTPLAPARLPPGHLHATGTAALATSPAATQTAEETAPTHEPTPATGWTGTSTPGIDAAAPEPVETYSLSVNDLPVHQLLFAIGRDAGLELDLHPGIEGRVTIHAAGQPLGLLLERIAAQAEIRYELRGRHLSVRPDTPFIRSYALDYVNLSREMRGSVATSTQIATTGAHQQGAANTAGNTSVTQIETRASNDFWNSLEISLGAILEEAGGTPRPCRTNSAGPCSADVMVNRESGVVTARASARQHAHLKAFLDQVQQAARRQVMIEATIVEVTLADGYRQGIDWTRIGLPGWNVRPRGTGDAASGLPTLSYLSSSADVQIELLETFGTVKVLSSPRLSVLNNQTAMLKVVEEVVYFLVDSTTTEYDDRQQSRITATTTPQSVSVGMVMSVTPQISANGEITLNVRPTISGISGFKDDPNPSLRSIPNRVPQIRTREIESMLRLRSGETAVLGGLMEDRVDLDTGRIPLLGDLPVVGELFTRRANAVRRTELLIFLRPLLISEPGIHGDYAGYATHLPADDFFTRAPSPGQRNFPTMPLRPTVLPAASPAATAMPITTP